MNGRIQKFNRDREFILAWSPPDEGWEIRVGASLEVDGQDNIYEVEEHNTEEGARGTKLNSQAKFVSHFQVDFESGVEFSLRVNSKGDISIFSGSRALFLNKEGKTLLSRGRVYRIITSAFSDNILLETFPEGRDEWAAFERYSQNPGKGNSGLQVTLNKQGSGHGTVSAIDVQGNSFVVALDDRERSMEFYSSGGEYLGKVPHCPKKSLPRAGGGDDFVTDGDGTLYRLELFPPWWGRKTAEGWIKIWKWERIK